MEKNTLYIWEDQMRNMKIYRRACNNQAITRTVTGLILGLRRANERRCYFVTASLIGWVLA